MEEGCRGYERGRSRRGLGCSPESAGVLSLYFGSLGEKLGQVRQEEKSEGFVRNSKGTWVGLHPMSEAGSGFSESLSGLLHSSLSLIGFHL